MGKNKVYLVLVASLIAFSAFGQQPRKYLVTFRDKANSPYSVSRPESFLSARSIERRQRQGIDVTPRDLPPNPTYVQGLRQAGVTVWYTSRWLNGALVEATTQQLDGLRLLPYVAGIESNTALNVNRGERTVERGVKSLETHPIPDEKAEVLNYGYSQPQVALIGADSMHARGFRGEGMLVGVLDNGFVNVNTLPLFKPLFDENRIVGTYDFVNKSQNVYDRGSHGTSVLSALAGYREGFLIGTAYKASFLLVHTEDDSGERLIEEANWLFGVEYADSVGVDVINSSLGYTTFDDPSTNHTYQDLNGQKTIATRAADWAAAAGIVVVVAAGNEGNKAWKYISAPADADSIIAVAAVDRNGQYAAFSSKGPRVDGRVKPDLAAMGQGVVVGDPGGTISVGSGTSYASPILAGMATGFWQAHPYLSGQQVIQALKESASQYTRPDEFLGYGIPNFVRASNWVSQNIGGGMRLYPNPSSGSQTIRVELPADFSSSSTFEARLTDLRGAALWTGTLTGRSFTLPLNTLPAGIYVLRLQGDQKSFATKVVRF
ncbi:MAG: S8 family peptidase [Cytophagaceae bacterium]|nr:S8 family peptidase [Cytophagaceae bacterium]